jgi:hypothetical protein
LNIPEKRATLAGSKKDDFFEEITSKEALYVGNNFRSAIPESQ